MFCSALKDNQVYSDWLLHYDPLLPEKVQGEDGQWHDIDSGVAVLPNGDVSFKLYAPNAGSVTVKIWDRRIDLVKNEKGVYEGVLPYDESFVGPHSFDYIVDGACFLSPYAPISWHRNRPVNCVDIHDRETQYILLNDVPHGAVTREIFWSETMNRWERCLVYTPPGYMNGTDSYPVLYLQHGATENEVTWEYNGRVSSIMDNLIASGEAVPFIIVMNNGMLSRNGVMGEAFADLLLNDCIPYIEKTYRVKTDKWNRALAGLSMGSVQTSRIGLSHPELFGYLGLFSGFLRHLFDKDPNVHLRALEDTEAFEANYKVFFRSIGDLDNYYKGFDEDDETCSRTGICRCANYSRVIYPGQTHEFGAWRRALYDFARLIFK